jgi:hypothetical protein
MSAGHECRDPHRGNAQGVLASGQLKTIQPRRQVGDGQEGI